MRQLPWLYVFGMILGAACGNRGGGGGGDGATLAEEALAEAVANLTLSTYHSTAISVSTNTIEEFTIECETSGEAGFSQAASDTTQLCYTVTSRACSFSTAAGGSMTMENTATFCGSNDLSLSESDGITTLMTEPSLSAVGNISLTTSRATRSCDYSLALSGIRQVQGSTSNFEVDITGDLCDRRDIDATVTVELDVTSLGELDEQTLAEAIVNNSISGYHTASVTVTGEDVGTIAVSCAAGGELSVSENEGGDTEVCLSLSSQSCSFDLNLVSLYLENTGTLCGSADLALAESDGITVLAGESEVTLAGDATVTTGIGSRTCTYDLTLSGFSESTSSSGHYDVTAEGTLCGNASFSGTIEIDLSVTTSSE